MPPGFEASSITGTPSRIKASASSSSTVEGTVLNIASKFPIAAVSEAGAGISDENRKIFYECLGTIASNLKKISTEGLSDDEC